MTNLQAPFFALMFALFALAITLSNTAHAGFSFAYELNNDTSGTYQSWKSSFFDRPYPSYLSACIASFDHYESIQNTYSYKDYKDKPFDASLTSCTATRVTINNGVEATNQTFSSMVIYTDFSYPICSADSTPLSFSISNDRANFPSPTPSTFCADNCLYDTTSTGTNFCPEDTNEFCSYIIEGSQTPQSCIYTGGPADPPTEPPDTGDGDNPPADGNCDPLTPNDPDCIGDGPGDGDGGDGTCDPSDPSDVDCTDGDGGDGTCDPSDPSDVDCGDGDGGDGTCDPNDPSDLDCQENGYCSGVDPSLGVLCTVPKKLDDLYKWLTMTPQGSDFEVDVQSGIDAGFLELDQHDYQLNVTQQCPTGEIRITIMGKTISQPLPYASLCEFARSIAPFLVAIAYISAALIVMRSV